MKEFVSAVEDALEEENADDYVEFKVDGRAMRAYTPSPGQLIFMMAALGRGQSNESRFAAIINIMMESLREDDAAYLEGRLLTRDRSKRLPPEKLEEIFEFLTEEWFARPTQPSSDSAESQPNDGQK